MVLADTLIQLAYDAGIKPNSGGLPGLPVLKQVMDSVSLFAITAVVGALRSRETLTAHLMASPSPGRFRNSAS
ncbi:hypothetical protein FNJ62_08125 [Streptomyces benahoarensis]|uniref:Uncharacterized protein n=1 Tax=Streptomyces benahoarensis TaxID=2595054 RepID=A0A553ZRL0_9ACTN|nr:hypothetical protein FNJ62_08125 [Streptomyces benahoarensis]TSB44073.1 hypothetical protein FNZ23_00775 [Streptomyces benahoarensis]